MLAIFDSNVYDVFADDETLRRNLVAAIESRRLLLLTTHVQRDELHAVADAQRRERLVEVLCLATPVATGSFVLGSSRIGEARLTSDSDAIQFDRTMRNGMSDARGTNDALIISTAKVEAAILVSQDRRCRARATRVSVSTAGIDEFVQRLNRD